MKENIEKKIETFVYGILSLAFGAAFFFGVLYPSQGLSPNACCINEPLWQESKIPERGYPRITHSGIRAQIAEYNREDICCTFLIYERLKNS